MNKRCMLFSTRVTLMHIITLSRYSDRYGFYDTATIEDEQSLEDLAERLDVMSDEKEVCQFMDISGCWTPKMSWTQGLPDAVHSNHPCPSVC